ncbi:ADP-ribose pyrophosphatase YjhB (NUDIX family) [Pedobacter cryoconitis]|uniref:ADP-ribose pyrophosphatase YjhB (NUDIX family) n=1 Tax=Pedobacter cryoconitis TaxID=188932 RepID=A0A7W8ZQI0_9SPHI|nr:NUDIX domain-containing protein [Pedobacter cryoconitis]MBB5638203.1 ADP-ribose pyrophosphatase YjhB (NUDIX family) [Pedobacter cryoconitis]
MELDQRIIEKSKWMWEKCLPHISVDSVVFGFHENQLKVLLVKTNSVQSWLLPGGYVLKNENLQDAAQRVLFERTGAERIYLQEFGVFGALNRSEEFFAAYQDDLWYKQRFISAGFYALVDYTEVNVTADEFSESCEWRSIDDLPELAMDHQLIYTNALTVLRQQLSYKPIGQNLLPERFTLPELQKLYETILGKPLNRGNFYRRIMRFDILVKHEDLRKGGAHKAPFLYSFDPLKYHESLQGFDW